MENNNMEVYSFTGLWNRYTFCRETEKLIRENPDKQYVILRWDIDQFSMFNDTYGSKTGDKVLKQVADLQLKRFGSTDKIKSIGHYNADHFVMCFVKGEYDPEQIMADILQDFKDVFPDYFFSIHMGLCEVDESVDIGLCCDRALVAIRKAKANYNTKYAWYDQQMRNQALNENKIYKSMHAALKNGEFVPWFQPQYNYVTGEISGAEVLVRWVKPKGIVPPNEFIPVFEKNGFIYEMDKYVCRQACKYLKEWTDKGYNIPSLSINVSRHDTYKEDFISSLLSIVDEFELPHEKIHIEITESAYEDNPEKLENVIDTLRSHGFTVEMDDFGSGYSSLTALKDLNISILKLDMGFLAKESNTERGGNIISSIVRMSHYINLGVIAEGVETKEQAEFLKTIGCYYMQGYYFSKPIPVNDFEELIKKQKKVLHETILGTGVENAADFLDASTQNTLLFNSFLGGAAIIEFDGKTLSFLRVNDKFFETMNITREVYENRKFDLLKGLDEKSQKSYIDMLDKAYVTGQEADCIVSYRSKRGEKYDVWAHNRVRYLGKKVDRLIYYVSIENITDRVRLEKENEKLSNELHSIVENLPGGVAIFRVKDDKFECEYISGAYYEQRGEIDANALSKDIVGAVYEEDRERVREKLNNAINTATPFYDVYRINTKDGIIWVESRSSFVGQPNDGLLYIYSNDITSIIEMREEGEYDRQRMQNLINSLDGGVAIFKVVGKKMFLDYFSEGMSTITGYTVDELKTMFGTDIKPLIFNGDFNLVWQEILKCVQEGKEIEFISRIIKKDGEIIWVKLHGKQVLKGQDTYIHCVYQSLSDITEIYGQLLDEFDSSLMVVDRKTNELLFVNDAAARYSGKKKEDLIGGHCYDIHGFDGICSDCPVNKIKDDKPVYRVKERADGRVMFEKYRAITWHGHDAFISFITDRTDVYKRKEELDRILENIPGGIAVVRHTEFEHKYIFISDVAKHLLGYDPDEDAFQTQTPNKYIDKGDYQKIVETARAAKTGVDIDFRVKDKNGNIRWLNLDSKFWTNRRDGIMYEFIVYADVTERRKAEDETRQLEQEYNATAIQSGNMVCRYVVKTRALIVQKEVAKAFDSVEYLENAPEELVKGGYIPKQFIPIWRGLFNDVESGKKIGEATLQIAGLKGKLRWYKANFITVFDSDGNPDRAVFSFEDITEKRENDKFQSAMQSGIFKGLKSVYPLIILFNITKNTYRVIESNEYVYHPENDNGRAEGNYDDLIKSAGEYLPIASEKADYFRILSRENVLKEYEKGNDVITMELRQIGEDGKAHWVRTHLMFVPDDYDDDVTAIGITRCIDDEKANEKKLTEALESASSELKVNEAENEIRQSMAQLGKMICRYDIESSLVFVPKAHAERHGTTECFKAPQPLDAISKLITDKKNQKKYYDFFKAINNGEHSGSVEILFSPSARAPFYEKYEFANIFDENGNPVRALISVEDTTKLHIEEEKIDKLKQNELIMRIVADHSNRVVLYYDVESQNVKAIDEERAKSLGLDILFNVHDKGGTTMTVADESKSALHVTYIGIISGESGSTKLHTICVDGKHRWFDICYTALKNNDGKFYGTVISILDITGRHEEEVAYARYQQTAKQQTSDNLVYVEADLTDDIIERVGGTDISALGLSIPEGAPYYESIVKYVEMNFQKDIHLRIIHHFSREYLLSLFEDGKDFFSDEWHAKYNEFGYRWVETKVQMVTDPYSGHVKSLLTVKDITEEKDAHMETQRRAQVDGLTGIYNRASTESFIEKHLSEKDSVPGVLIMIDLDDLKYINDNFGHQEGDKALKLFANTLKRHFRNTDIIGRIGGDEFMAYLPGVKSEVAIRSSIDNLLQKVKMQYVGPDNDRKALSFSAGCTFATPELDTFSAAFKRADTALYHVKRNGKGDYMFYTSEMQLSTFKYERHKASALKKNDLFDKVEISQFLNAIGQFYPTVISANLTNDNYYFMSASKSIEELAPSNGSYRSLIFTLVTATKKEDKDVFNTFSIESLLEEFNNGNTSITKHVRQINSLGKFVWVEVSVFLYNNDAHDVCAFLLGKQLPDNV